MDKKEIFILRHGETDYNAQRIIQGRGVNSDLNRKGRAQGMAFYDKYKGEEFEVVLTSELKRTQQTVASFINDGIPWEKHGEIDEMDWGIHEGKKGTPAMKNDYVAMTTAWKSGNYNYRIEGGESAQELADRLTIFVNHLKTRAEEKILVCSHGRAMRCLMAVLKEDALKDMEQYMHHNTGLYKVIFNGKKFDFETVNDISHLEDLNF